MHCITDNIRRSLDALKRGGSGLGSCIVCGSVLTRPTLFSADAGRAFEALSESVIDRAITMLSRLAERSPLTSKVQVLRQRPFTAGFGRDVSRKFGDRHVFWIGTLQRIVRGFWILRSYAVGEFRVRQVPIGGPLSTAILDWALAFMEWSYDYVSMIRFVDDLLGGSFLKCLGCAKSIVHQTYSGAITFDFGPESDSVGDASVLPFLAYTVVLAPSGVFVCFEPNFFPICIYW